MTLLSGASHAHAWSTSGHLDDRCNNRWFPTRDPHWPGPDAGPDFDAPVQPAGRPSAVEANPDVCVLQDAESDVAAITADGSQLRFSIPAQGPASVRGEMVVFNGASASNSVAIQRTAEGVRALVGIAAPEAADRYSFPVRRCRLARVASRRVCSRLACRRNRNRPSGEAVGARC